MRTANDVKVYNLSAGKSLPEWISERKRRALLKNDIGASEGGRQGVIMRYI